MENLVRNPLKEQSANELLVETIQVINFQTLGNTAGNSQSGKREDKLDEKMGDHLFSLVQKLFQLNTEERTFKISY